MGTLHNVREGRTVVLEAEQTAGRSTDCRMQIAASFVSVQHALIRWTGAGWEIRDLASTNGTFVDGSQLTPGEPRPLRRGSVVTFGRLEQRWEMVDEDPPQVMLLPDAGGPPVLMTGEILALPSSEDPVATVFRGADGTWKLERPEDVTLTLSSGARFEVGGRSYRLSCPAVLAPTTAADGRPGVTDIQLQFRVSRDEEHVEIRVQRRSHALALPVRNHNYLLLLLARKRRQDEDAGDAETSCGWTYKDDLLRALQITVNQLNVDIFRIRKQFEGLELASAAQVIEWRPRTRELRLGVARPSIERL
jgi:hypothetical protein